MKKAFSVHPSDISQAIVLTSVQIEAVVHMSEIFLEQDTDLCATDPADTRFNYQKLVRIPISVKFNGRSFRFDYVRDSSLAWSLRDIFKEDVDDLEKMFGTYGVRQLQKEIAGLANRAVNTVSTAYTMVDSVKETLLSSSRALVVKTHNINNEILQLHALEDGTYIAIIACKKMGHLRINAVRKIVYRDEIRDILSLIKGYRQMGNSDVNKEFMFMFEILSAPEIDQDLFLEAEEDLVVPEESTKPRVEALVK